MPLPCRSRRASTSTLIAPVAAAAVTYLDALSPHRAADYRWMQDEVLYSRLYMAGHVTSDITAGTLLGDLVGDDELAVSGR